MLDDNEPNFFHIFTEIAILGQLSNAVLQANLPTNSLVSHFTVLNHLVRTKDGATPLELANAFQVAKTTMTHTLSGLESAGHVKMTVHKNDARSKQIWLTRKGRNLRSKTIESLSEDMMQLQQLFPEGRVKKLLPELEELRRIMDELRNNSNT